MIRIDREHAQKPIGGHMADLDGMHFTGKTVDEVIEGVYRYRAAAALPAGQPEQEVAAIYREKSPWLVSDCEETEDDRRLQFQDACASSISRVWRNFFTFLSAGDQKVVERRAICANCPHRVVSEEPTNVYQIESLRRLARLTGETVHAGWCRSHQTSCSLLTRLVEIEKLNLSKAVGGCWYSDHSQPQNT